MEYKLKNNMHTFVSSRVSNNVYCIPFYFPLQKKTQKKGSLSFQISLIPFTLIHSLYRRDLSHAFFLTLISLAVILA